jgi:hypothetical protein
MDAATHEIVVWMGWGMGLLLLLVLALLGVSVATLRRVGQLQRSSRVRKVAAEPVEEAPPAVETSPGGAFEAFLEEDPARRNLPKNEQFKAYRKWRQEKGYNWSAP